MLDSKPSGEPQIGRREILDAALSLAPLLLCTQTTTPAPAQQRGPLIVVGGGNAVVNTAYGKVRGYTESGIHNFKGIPYGDSTAGQARFAPPQRPKPWTGIRDSMQYGSICPWTERNYADVSAFFWEYEKGRMREDCLNLNIWTPAVNDGRKRPVLFWLHGGGLTMGSSNEFKAYDGANLSRRGDVVVVSVDHRLNGFGFLNLMEFGERYKSSAHSGMLDVVAALEWVNDNIAGFGGDPGNVTLFGWSGGGAKVNFLLTMPTAKGLFHKAVAQSPIPLITKPLTVEQSLRVSAQTIERLGLNRSSIAKIHDLPATYLVNAVLQVLIGTQGFNTAPVLDSEILPSNPFHPEAPQISAHVPLMVGTTMRETGPCLGCKDDTSEADLRKLATAKHGDQAEHIIDAFRASYPKDSPFDLWTQINFFEHRQNALLQTERKAALKSAPAFLYSFGWRTPVFEGKPRAFHGSELAFVFDNTDRCVRMTGGTDEARVLAARVSAAWIQFARTGNPSHAGLPAWPAVTSERRPTMVFDNQCELKVDHDQQARQAWTAI